MFSYISIFVGEKIFMEVLLEYESIMDTINWVRIQDPTTLTTHHAYPDDDHKNVYVTECNIVVTTADSSTTQEHKTGWKLLDRSIRLTCDDCLLWISMGPIGDE